MNDSDTIKTVELEYRITVMNIFKYSEMYILLYLKKDSLYKSIKEYKNT